MRSDVHLAALRAAARVAFSVSVSVPVGGALVGACSSSTVPAASNGDAGTTSVNPTAPGEAPEKGASPGTGNGASDGAVADAAPTDAADGGAADGANSDATGVKPDCDALIAGNFPDAGPNDYVYNDGTQPMPTAPAPVMECCKQKLLATGGVNMPYRFHCCTLLIDPMATDTDRDLANACTPWGPPVPPSMSRGRRGPQVWGIA